MREQKGLFLIVGLAGVCLLCQIAAIMLLCKKETGPEAEEIATVSNVSSAPSREDESHTIKRQYRKLRQLRSQEDFLEFTDRELKFYECLKKNELPIDSFISFDMNKPDFLEKAAKCQTQREEWLQKNMEEAEQFIEGEDLSCLTEEEQELLINHLEDRRLWAKIAYDDSVDMETKMMAFKVCLDVHQEIATICRKLFDANYGEAYKQYQRLSQEADVGHPGNYTNRWWINTTVVDVQGEDGKDQNYRVKLFE